MMRYHLAAILLLTVSLLNAAYSQGIITGRVFDLSSKESLAGVYVIYGKAKGTASDQDGRFTISADSAKMKLLFQFLGYRSVEQTAIIGKGETVSLDVGMEMEIRDIGQIVISANKREQKIAELTVSMDVLKADKFLNSHITDAEELINKTPGIEVMDGQASVRGGSGFSYGAGSRVMALIDGLPVVSPDAGNIKWQFLPFENISQIEIIKGASSVLYGSSALNGVINFRSSDAGIKPSGQFYAETGLFDKPKNINWKWWDTPRSFSSLSFSHLQKAGNNDLGVGAYILYDKGYRKLNDEKLGRLSLRFKHYNQKVKGLKYGMNVNAGYTEKTDFVLWEDADYGALKQDTSTASLLHGTFLAVDPYISYKGSGKFTHDFRVRFQSSSNRFPVRNNNNSDALAIFSEYQMNYRFADYLGITAGLSETFSNVISNFYGDHTGMNLAGFAQIEANPVQALKLVAGVRLEQNALDSEMDELVPVFRTGINWKVAEYSFLRASFGEGYRYPSIAEKYASTTLGSVKIFPNPYVEPESGWSTELGFKQGVLIGKTSGQFDLSVFMSQNENMIEYIFSNYPDPVTGVFDFGFQATNVEQARVYGTEAEFSLTRSTGSFTNTLAGGYTYIYPVEYNPLTNENTDIYLKYRRKHSAQLSLGTSFKSFEAGLTLFARSKILNIDDVFLNPLTRESILPGFYDYWLENNTGYLTIDGNIGMKLNSKLSLSFAVKNITNTEYMGRPGDIQPHRNFSIRISGKY
jgi:outer membrane cobalamin receptor